MDLRSKLGLYKENSISNQNSISDQNRSRPEGLDIQDLIPGALCNNASGSFYNIENKYPCSHIHGGSSLGAALDITAYNISRLCSDNNAKVNISELLFLDTETTGLSGGAGTIAFLIGIGYFQENHFILKQFFIRDYNEEPAALEELNNLIAGYKGLVTFNGKSFDWNLLLSRFTSSRIRPLLKSPVHVDLLFPSRRIWGLRLESCRLSSIEENILGEKRTDDIPGAMIPEVYFKYLESRNASDIIKVIKHNELDILSMVSLLVKMSEMLENPLAEGTNDHEVLGLGKIFEKCGEKENFLDCYEYCVRSTEALNIKSLAARRLSTIYKQKGEYDKALELWESLLSSAGGFSIFPMVEMAMYYEHKDKNIKKASEIIERAITVSRQTGLSNTAWFPELIKRHERLKRKAQKIKVDA